MGFTPLFLNAEKHGAILVVGGGEIAAAKTEALASVGARVDIVSQDIEEAVALLCVKHDFKMTKDKYRRKYLKGRKIVVAATDNDDVNARIARDCNKRGILVNVVDNPPLCDFIFPALIRRGNLQIAVSSSGVSPVLARMVKHAIEQAVPINFTNLIKFMGDKKKTLREKLPKIQPRRLIGEDIYHGPIAEEVLSGNRAKADKMFDEMLEAYPKHKQAALYLVGAGPGNPELMTIKAIRLLSKADLILYDRLVSPVILEQYARKDAEKVFCGKTRDHHHKTQAQIDQMIEDHLRKGDVVVRLKGGDPGIYAHGAEEIAIAQKVGVPYQIVPGISAANGCAAYSGVPLTERGGALSVRFITLYKDMIQDDDFWMSIKYAKNETFVFYMSTPHYPFLCEKLMELGYSADTPMLVVEQGTTDQHRQYAFTIGTYSPREFASPALLIVGDVARWAETYQWKDAPEEYGSYFPPIDKEKKVA